jgi:hypothetical protein
MKCGRETEHPHQGVWIATKTTTTTADRAIATNIRERFTVTRYREAEVLAVALCDQCLADEVRKFLRRNVLGLAGISFLLTLGLVITGAWHWDGTGFRVFLDLSMVLCWGSVLFVWLWMAPRIMRGEVYRSYDKFLRDFAGRRARELGKDTILTLPEWEAIPRDTREALRKAEERF